MSMKTKGRVSSQFACFATAENNQIIRGANTKAVEAEGSRRGGFMRSTDLTRVTRANELDPTLITRVGYGAALPVTVVGGTAIEVQRFTNILKSILIVILIGFSLATIAQSQDLAGTWISDYVLTRGLGPDAVFSRLVFQQQNGSLNGASIGNNPGTLTDIRVRDRDVSFSLRNGTDVTTYRGTLDGNELQMLSDTGGRYKYRRASRDELEEIKTEPSHSYKKLPLPELHDVPSNGLAMTPPMGVGSFTLASDKAIRELADLMVSNGFRDAGYVYIQIDEGWQGRRDAQGNLHPNKNFSDMKALADYLHSRGFKFGVYSSPGPLGCYGYAGSYGHEEQDAKTFAEWGVDYLKYDWCSAWALYHTQAEMQALYQKMGEALERSGRPIVFALSQYGWHDVGAWGQKVGSNRWRTCNDVHDDWASMSRNGFDLNGDPSSAGPGHWNDPDDLQIGKGRMTTEEYRTHMTLWSIQAAPLFIDMNGNDVAINDMAKWSPEIKSILLNKEVIAIDQDRLGVQGRRVLRKGLVEFWTKRLSGNASAVALFNRGATTEKVSFRWADIGLTNVQSARDLWSHNDVNNIFEGYEVMIPSHGSVVLRVTAAQ
jgi:alpha-galactosidase